MALEEKIVVHLPDYFYNVFDHSLGDFSNFSRSQWGASANYNVRCPKKCLLKLN